MLFFYFITFCADEIKYKIIMHVIMQQRKTCEITVNNLLMKGGYFEEFKYKM